MKNQGFVPLVVAVITAGILSLGITGWSLSGNKQDAKLKTELKQLITDDSAYLNEAKIENATSNFGVYSMAKTIDGEYIFLKINSAKLRNEKVIGSILYTLPNGELLNSDDGNYLSTIILKDGSKTEATVVKKMITFIRGENGELMTLDLSNAQVVKGFVEGLFSGKSLDGGYQIAGRIENSTVVDPYIVVSPSYISPVVRTLSEILKIEVEIESNTSRVLAKSTTAKEEREDSTIDIEGKIVTRNRGKNTYQISGVEEPTVDLSTVKKLVESSISTATVTTATGQVTYKTATQEQVSLLLADDSVTSAKIADLTIVAADIANGTITSSKFASGITATPSDDSVNEAKINAVDTAADEECLTYEHSTGNFEWQTCGGAGNSGTITGITAGTGLSGGGTSGAVTVSLDDSQSLTDLSLSSGTAPITLSHATFANCTALETDADGIVTCGTDDGGAGSGIATVQEGDSTAVSSATTLDFLAADFVVSNSPAGEGNISIDYTNSKIVRSDQSETIANAWIFSSGLTVNSETVTDFSGTGITVTGGALTSTLGTSIANTELVDDTLDFDKISDSPTLDAATSITAGSALNLSIGNNVTLLTSGTGAITATDLSCTDCIGATEVSDLTLGTDTAGNYVATITAGSGISGSSSTEGGTPTLALSALTADWTQSGAYDVIFSNSSGELKIKESTGDTYYGIFDVGDLGSADATYTFSGTSGTVLTTTNVASSLSGWDQDSSSDLTTSTSFSGDVSGNYNTLAIGANTVALTTDTTGDYLASLTQGTGITITGATGEGSNPTINASLGTSISNSEIDNDTIDLDKVNSSLTLDEATTVTAGSALGLNVGNNVTLQISGTGQIIATDLSCTDCIGSSEILSLAWSEIGSTPTTISGYGLTDVLSNSNSSTQNAYFGDIYLYDDTTASHYLQITNAQNLTASHVLSITTSDADRTLTISGDANISGTTSGTNTGDQTITLQGDVTGSGTGTFTTTIADASIDYADLDAIDGDTASNGDCLSYDTGTGGTFEWVSCGGGSGTLDDAYNSGTATVTVDAYDILFDLNDSTNDYKFTIDNNTNATIDTAFSVTTLGGASSVFTTAIDLSDADIVTAIALGANDITVNGATISAAEFSLLDSGIALSELTDSGTLTAGTVDINGGAIDGTAIGATTRSTALFTTLGTNGNVTLGDANADTLTINAGSSGTGISFGDSSFANCSALETASGVLTCGSDDTGVGGGISTIQVGDADTVTSATTIDFLAADFDVTNSPAGEGNVSIDYTNSKIVRSDQNESITGSWTFNTDATLNFSGTEDLAITHDLVGTANIVTITATPDDVANTAYGIYIDQADGANTNGLDAALVIDNSDTSGAVITTAIKTIDAGGGFTNLFDIAGTLITAAEFTILDSGIALSELTDSGTLTAGTVDINGGAIDGVTIGANSAGAGTFTNLTAGGTVNFADSGADTITIGDANDSLTLLEANWGITDAGVASFITGSVLGSTTFTTNNIADSGALTIKSATTNALTLDSGTTGTINIGTGTGGKAINIGTDNTTKDTIGIGSALDDVAVSSDSWSVTNAGAGSFVSVSSTNAIAANGGITFDASTDTLGAFTAAGTIDLNDNILTNLGSTGTDFDTSGGLTLTLDAAAGTAVLVVNNSSQASSIFVAQDNGSPVFTIADGGGVTLTGTLAVNGDSITADGATLTINAGGTVDVDDILNANSITSDAGVSIAAGNSYTGAGAVSLTSAATTALTVDSGTTGAVDIATGNNIKTISIGTGTAGNTVNIGTNNTTKDTISLGSALDDVAITSDSWSITNAGALTVASCTGCGGGAGSLDVAYNNGATITVDAYSVIWNLSDATNDYNFVIDNATTGDIAKAFEITSTGVSATTAVAIDISDADIVTAIALGANDITVNGATISAAEFSLLDSGIALSELTDSGTLTAGTVDINGGAIDGVTIGANSAGAGTFTALTMSGDVTLNDAGADSILIGQSGATDDVVTIAGNISLTDDNWSITDAGIASFITGSVLGSTTFTTNNIADSGALTIKSATTNALTLDSGTTGAINIGTGTLGKTISIGTDNTTKDTINIGSALDDVAISSDSWSITNAGAASFASITENGSGLSSVYAPIGADYITVAANGTLTGETAIGSLTAAISTTSTLNVDSSATIASLTLDANTGSALTISGTSFTTDITLQNGETIDNDTDAQFNLKANTDTTVTILGADTVNSNTPLTISSSGTGALTLDPTGAGSIVLGSADVTSITFTTDNNAATDFNFTGGLTTSGAIAANGGITFDAATDTLGAYTMSGTVDANANVIANIGSTGTDFTSSGAMTITLDAAEANGALIVDNGSQANPIFVAKDNAGIVFSIIDGGDIEWEASSPNIMLAAGEIMTIGPTGGDTFTLDTSGSSMSFSDGTNSFTFDVDTGPLYAGTARPTKTILVSPEYPGAVLTADTSNNIGTMTSDNDASGGYRNYYKWTTTQGSNQDYDIFVRIPIPMDYAAMAATPTLSVDTYSSDTTNGTITVKAYGTDGVASGSSCNFISFTPTGTSSWETKTATTCLDSGTFTAGGVMTLDIHMQSPASGDVRVGDIKFNYLSKF